MCPCALPRCPPWCCVCAGGEGRRARASGLQVTAARLKAIGDELQARVQEQQAAAGRRGRRGRALAGPGLATSLLLLLLAWVSRRRSA